MKMNSPPARWGLAVYALVRDARGRVLMLRRSPHTKNFPGLWDLPGGKSASGETFDETARVEVFEETGLDVKLTGVVGAVESVIPGMRAVLLILEARTRTTGVTLSEEHVEYRWLPLAQVPALDLYPAFKKFFAGYAKQAARPPAKKTGAGRQ